MSDTAAPVGPGRHEARERAVELLYESDARTVDVDAVLAQLPLDPDPYAVTAVRGIEGDRTAIDALINDHAQGWSIERMPLVDRAILRLAVWELRSRDEIPVAVVLDEAVELAKDYSTERSPSFINGVLDAIAASVRG